MIDIRMVALLHLALQHPGLVVMSHVVARCMQIGALGGALASVGVWAKQGGSAATWARGTAPKIALRGAGVGVVAGFAMAAGKAYSNDFVQDDVDDRAYRLMHNGIVNTMDRVTTGACMIGAGCGALGAVVGTQNVAVKVSRGGALGVAVGFAGLAATAVVKKWQSSA